MYARMVVLRSQMQITEAREQMVSKAHLSYRLGSLLVTRTLLLTRALFPAILLNPAADKQKQKCFCFCSGSRLDLVKS